MGRKVWKQTIRASLGEQSGRQWVQRGRRALVSASKQRWPWAWSWREIWVLLRTAQSSSKRGDLRGRGSRGGKVDLRAWLENLTRRQEEPQNRGIIRKWEENFGKGDEDRHMRIGRTFGSSGCHHLHPHGSSQYALLLSTGRVLTTTGHSPRDRLCST